MNTVTSFQSIASLQSLTSFHTTGRIPIITDVSTLPVKPQEPTPENPFMHPKPKIVTGLRSWIRVIQARHMLVVLDSDLAELYGTTVDAVNKAVMRNACCFPKSICFRLANDEWHHLQRTSDIGNVDRGNWLCAPLVFTCDGALAISNTLDTFDATRGSVLIWRTIYNLESMGRTPA